MVDIADELFYGVGIQPMEVKDGEPSYEKEKHLDDIFGVTQQRAKDPGITQEEINDTRNLNQLFGVSETAGEATAANPIKRAYLGAQRQWEGFGLDLDWDKARTIKDPEARAKRIAELQDAQKSFETKWAKEGDLGYAGDVAGVVSGMVRGTKGGIDEALVGGGIALGVGQLGPQAVLPEELITVPVGLKTGLAFGTAKEWKSQGSGEIYRDLITTGVDHDRANWWADKAGLLYAGIEYSQMDKLLPGGKKLVNGTIKQIVKQAVTNYGKNVISESAEEGLQRVVTDMAKDIATLKDKGLSNEQVRAELANNTGKYFQGFAQDFEASIPAMMLLGSPGAIIDTKQAIKAQQSQQPAQPGAITEQPQAQQPAAEQVQQPAYTEEQQGAPQEAVIPQTPDQQLDALFTAPETNLTPGMEQPLETDEQRAARTQREYEVIQEQEDRLAQEAVAGKKAEAVQAELDQYQGMIDPYQALKEYIRQPQTVNRQGRQIVRMSPGAIYIGGEKGDPLPGEYRDLQRAFGFHFTTDPTKGQAIDDVLNQFSNDNPGYAMDDNQFREGLRKIQQTKTPLYEQGKAKVMRERIFNLGEDRKELESKIIPDTDQQEMVLQDMKTEIDELLKMKEESENLIKDNERIIREERSKLGDLLLRGATMGSHQVNNKQAMIKSAEFDIMSRQSKLDSIMSQLNEKQNLLDKLEIDELPVIKQPLMEIPPLGIIPPEIRDLPIMKQKVEESFNRFGAKFDVEKPFTDIGAPKTGEAIKLAFTRLEEGEQLAHHMAEDLTILKNKIQGRTKAELVFLSEKSIPVKTKEEAALVDRFKEYMDIRYKELSDHDTGIFRFPDSFINRLQQEIEADGKTLSEYKKNDSIPRSQITAIEKAIKDKQEKQNELKKMNYVPLGHAVTMSFQRQLEEKIDNKESITTLPFFVEKGKFASFREILGRKSVSAKALYDKGLLKDEDLDLIMQGAYYTRYVYDKLAQKAIIDAALEEGLGGKFKRDKDWMNIPQLPYPLNKYYWNSTFGEYMRDMFDTMSKHDSKWYRKVLTFMKMHQFISPFAMLVNNLSQVSFHPITFLKLSKHFKSAARMLNEKGADYQEAMWNGLSPVPDRNPLGNFKKQIDLIQKNHGQDINTKMMNWGIDWIQKNTLMKLPAILEDIYNTSWNVTWQMDRFLRLALYNQFLDEGIPSREAARETALMMGDYAGIPIKTRRAANLLLFTFSYKAATLKYYGTMIKGMWSWIRKESSGDKTKEQINKIRAQGLILLIGMTIGKHFFMVGTGAKTKEFSRKYAYSVNLDNGQEKDFNMTFSTPFNLPMRYWYRLVQPSGEEPNYFARLSKTGQYELNPLWRVGNSLISNKRFDGLPIADFDDDINVALSDYAKYIAGETYALLKPVMEEGTKADREYKEALKNSEKELIWRAAQLFSYQYVSDQKPEELAKKLQAEVSHFQNRLRLGLINEDPRTKERMEMRKKNFLNKLGDKKENLQKVIKDYNEDSSGFTLDFLD